MVDRPEQVVCCIQRPLQDLHKLLVALSLGNTYQTHLQVLCTKERVTISGSNPNATMILIFLCHCHVQIHPAICTKAQHHRLLTRLEDSPEA